jgi:nucleoside-diphosphate kinase
VERTLIIVKPDGVARGLVGEILGRFEAKGLRLAALEVRTLGRDVAERHYAEHHGRDYYEGLISFITSGPVAVAVLEGPDDTWAIARSLIGATNPALAAPGTIRGDLGLVTAQNLVHGSDSAASAQREIAIFFPHLV